MTTVIPYKKRPQEKDTITTSISISRRIRDRADRIAEQRGYTRSELIELALERLLEADDKALRDEPVRDKPEDR